MRRVRTPGMGNDIGISQDEVGWCRCHFSRTAEECVGRPLYGVLSVYPFPFCGKWKDDDILGTLCVYSEEASNNQRAAMLREYDGYRLRAQQL